jgi:hypothetical protein
MVGGARCVIQEQWGQAPRPADSFTLCVPNVSCDFLSSQEAFNDDTDDDEGWKTG